MGGNVRVGLEDSLWGGRGRLAETNAEQVRTARQIIEGMGHDLPPQLVERSALTGLVLRTSLRAVMSARAHLPALTEHELIGPALAAEDEFDVTVVNDDLEHAADRLVALMAVDQR